MIQNIRIQQYGSGMLRVLAGLDEGVIERLDFDYARSNSVRMTASIEYHDGSRIRIRLIINTDSDYPDWRSYSFHYMTAEDTTIFRYDNAIHYPDTHTFPHHKHEGANERVIDCPQPSIRAIRDEIVAYLNNLSRS